VITLLAVLEHLREEKLPSLINEIFRTLRPEGIFVMTTPAGHVGTLLRVLTKIRFVSAVEIDEHQRLYGKPQLRQLLQDSNFDSESVRVGSFELWMNNWLFARKSGLETAGPSPGTGISPQP
jgi:2-polyprenyl-3-methyl-5-hydroxy-6-metoxy-1,4-benzoquinol methylase